MKQTVARVQSAAFVHDQSGFHPTHPVHWLITEMRMWPKYRSQAWDPHSSHLPATNNYGFAELHGSWLTESCLQGTALGRNGRPGRQVDNGKLVQCDPYQVPHLPDWDLAVSQMIHVSTVFKSHRKKPKSRHTNVGHVYICNSIFPARFPSGAPW